MNIQRVRAIIIKDGKVLLMHRIKSGLEYWAFPGGGIEESDKSPEDGLKRECLEELGVEVEVKELFMNRSSIAPHRLGQMESFYLCNIVNGEVGTGTGPEFTRDVDIHGSYEVEWLPISEIKNKNVWPVEVRDKIVI
jgi:ADP-ribose pyrophosphatase YjhB (NUDIX family)